MRPILQNRWKVEGNYLYYYGFRKAPNTFNNKIKLSKMDIETVSYMNGYYELSTYKITKKVKELIANNIIVDKKDYIYYPKTLREAHFCEKCGLNDYALPGLELDSNKLCPICANNNLIDNFLYKTPEIGEIKNSPNLKYDCAIFLDGTMDSIKLLDYLALTLKLRVLVLTLEDNSTLVGFTELIDKIENKYENIKVVTKETDNFTDKYNIFYPILVEENIPYLILAFDDIGICKNNDLKYKKINLRRKILRQVPLSLGQLKMLCRINYKYSFVEKYKNIVVKSYKSGTIPELVHISTDLIAKKPIDFDFEMVGIEKLKLDIIEFKEMKSKNIPDILIKSSLFVNLGFKSKKQIIEEYNEYSK